MNIIELSAEALEIHRETMVHMLTVNMTDYHYADKIPTPEEMEARFDQLLNYLKDGQAFFLAAIEKEELVGFIWLYQRPFLDYKRLIINSFFVNDTWRSRGIGTQLVNAAEQLAQTEGCREMATHYSVENPRAGHFYEKNGFLEKRVEVVKEITSEDLP